MYRENKRHLQEQLFTSYAQMDERIQKRLENSWAPVYYEHVFCKIDEMDSYGLAGYIKAFVFTVIQKIMASLYL